MRTGIFYPLMTLMITGVIFTSCESKEKKVEDAKENVQDAKKDLKEAQQDLNAEYPAFRTDAEKRIADNDKRIAELQEKIDKPGKAPLDDARKKRIEELKQKNADLRSRLYGYEKERSNWESFKREWNNDMEGLDQSVRDLGRDNTK
jgi:F0F1-type ATP synthase membrane subunit b/b'